MLGAFFTPPYRDFWLKYARDPDAMHPCYNHWLVCKSAAHEFSQGFVRLQRLQHSMIQVGDAFFA